MKTYKNPSYSRFETLSARPHMDVSELMPVIDEVFEKVSKDGDRALDYFTRKFDKVKVQDLSVPDEELRSSKDLISDDLRSAILTAKNNITKFHAAQAVPQLKVQIADGIECRQKNVPIGAVGLYVPGGSAPLFSSVLMLAIPAQIADCRRKVLCTPPSKDGSIHPAILFAAYICDVDEVYAVGGAQAIAAMTIGTETIAPVDKIFGPGNQYVTAAKLRSLQYGKGIDMPAGPSELLVFADETAMPDFVAADLLSQAEHGIDSQVILVATQDQIIKDVKKSIRGQLKTLPRKDIAKEALKNSRAVYFDNVEEAFGFINHYAPEHFIVASRRPDSYKELITNAGSVFLGNYTPESAGDYASGTNHTLPTGGSAKAFSGVNLDSYYKKITFQKLTKSGLTSLAPAIKLMAREELLEGHARAVDVRLNR